MKDHFADRQQIGKMIQEITKFDRKETKSALQLVTFHDGAGRMIFESYVPVNFTDEQATTFAARLIPPYNPLKEKLKSASVKRR